MKRNLVFKLTTCFLLLIFFVLGLLNTAGYQCVKNYITEQKRESLYDQATLISSEYLDNISKGDLDFNEYTTVLKAISNSIHSRIFITNNAGKIVCDTDASLLGTDLTNYEPDILSYTYYRKTTLHNLLSEESMCVIYPIPYSYKLRNYVIILLPYKQVLNESMKYTNILTIFALFFLAVILLLFIYIYLMLAHPLKKIRKAAMEYGKGNFKYKLNVKGKDEFHDVATALNYMAIELQSLDEYQKKFIANISHDFRSPLTSIKGYAEAILDGTIPYEMQPKYLDIIVFETERLNKLTNNLLELNRFDSKRNILEMTSFDINQIIKKTCASFEGICTKKKIQFNLVFSDKELFVTADLGKIQQVLYNLIDNAIKFSHTNSKIKISSNEKGEKAFISVKDYGIGIPKASLNKIWERFYKQDISRGKDKKGTGLGLSITKEIILAHNENIDVISTEGVGSEFTFSLPLTDMD